MPIPPAEPHNFPQAPPHARHLALQCAAAFTVLSLAWPYFTLRGLPLPWPATALVIGAFALLLASLTRQVWWWRLIHLSFAPLAWLVSTLAIDPGWYLLSFFVMLLIYRGALSGQIPLYLSGRDTTNALSALLPDHPGVRFVDLGAGIGSVIRPLSARHPQVHFSGVENAPAAWLIGRWRTIGLRNCSWLWGDIWRTDLAGYDVVYAFLSPAPMAALWEKAQREMAPGCTLISNSFAIPDVEPSQVITADEAGQTRLFCYRIPAPPRAGCPDD